MKHIFGSKIYNSNIRYESLFPFTIIVPSRQKKHCGKQLILHELNSDNNAVNDKNEGLRNSTDDYLINIHKEST